MVGLGQRTTKISTKVVLVFGLLVGSLNAWAGGGMVLQDDVCIVEIGFYSAHFTAYQPQSQGNTEFCQSFPDTGETLFVLDYLHNSMKEIPIDFRIIRDDTGLGQYVQLADVEAIQDINGVTVFYNPPLVEADASLQVSHSFSEGGDYIGIVTAGHPSNGKTYHAVFPFSVAKKNYMIWLLWLLLIPLIYLGKRSLTGPRAVPNNP